MNIDKVHKCRQDFWLEGGDTPQITRNDVIKNFRKEGFFMGQSYRWMEDQNPRPGLACNLDFAKGGGLEAKVKKISKIV